MLEHDTIPRKRLDEAVGETTAAPPDERPSEDGPVVDQRIGPVARFDPVHSILWIGGTPLPFRPGTNRNAELIELLGLTIRSLRGLGEDEPCLLRRSEYDVLAQLLDLDDPELRSTIRIHLGLSRRQAGDTVMRLRRTLVDHDVLAD